MAQQEKPGVIGWNFRIKITLWQKENSSWVKRNQEEQQQLTGTKTDENWLDMKEKQMRELEKVRAAAEQTSLFSYSPIIFSSTK